MLLTPPALRATSPASLGRNDSGSADPDLAIEPDVLEAPAVVDAVDLDRHALDVGLPASRRPAVGDDRPGDVLLQLAIDLPHHLQALLLVELLRLRLEQLGHLGIAVVVVVAQRAAGVALEEGDIGIVD